MAEYKNRIIGSGVEPLDQIMFNPRNWRVHPLNQQNALKGVLDEVGWVQEVIINKRTGHLVDGHLRCQLAAREGATTIPVKYVDLSEEEEALVLSTLDPIAAMATTDREKLNELFESINSDNAQVQALIDDISKKELVQVEGMDGFDFSGLPSEDRAPFRQVTFTLHDSQFEQVEEAIRLSKGMGDFDGSPNENSNGNAIARICEMFITANGNC